MTEPIFVHPAEARRRFVEFAEGEIDSSNLAYGALLVALEEYPSLDLDRYIAYLDDLATRTLNRASTGEPGIFMVGHLQGEMFDIDGFEGDVTSYYDPRNAYLNEVIERRKGLPISLAIIFLHVAHRVGIDAVGVGLPGHYIVKVRSELSEIYIDCFRGGNTLTVQEISALISGMSAGRMTLRSEHLRGWGGRETLSRVLANLQAMYSEAGEPRKALAAQERVEILERTALPESAPH